MHQRMLIYKPLATSLGGIFVTYFAIFISILAQVFAGLNLAKNNDASYAVKAPCQTI